MQTWPIQDAKTRWSELLEAAQSQPQNITVQGQSVAVMVSRSMFDRLTQAQDSLVDFMRRSPLVEAEDVVLERDTSPTRKVGL
nr:type II toxin-antitoxin system Phd/YefM family antitoxin [uncultured Albidiferax sp.]